jgi:predicted metal-dependent hydrolase
MRVKFYVSDFHACGYVRGEVIAREINKRYAPHTIDVKSHVTLSDYFGTDIMVFQRQHDLNILEKMRQAKRIFTERLNHFAPRLQVQWHKLSLSSATTRWGTASADGAIRLNWRVVHFKMDVIDYVVAHELSHLRVMNHGPQFWETVGTVVPDYAQRRQLLKDDSLPRW